MACMYQDCVREEVVTVTAKEPGVDEWVKVKSCRFHFSIAKEFLDVLEKINHEE
ncbi:hypothetical protein [uncultured Mediterranean phage]|nr:hypothetical protein [uncultured Mediterranean phage]